MQDLVVGRLLRAMRQRRGWRQADLADRAGVSQRLVSTIERGHFDATTMRSLRLVFAAVDARLDLTPSWRGADLDRLLDADHAALVRTTVDRLERAGWQIRLEVTYAEYGERGSIDVLALQPAALACLVLEIKSAVPSSEATGRKLDEKARLASRIVERTEGWRPVRVGRVLVVPETSRLRRLIDHDPNLRRMLPGDALAIRQWLRRPAGGLAAIWFLSPSTRAATRRRIRVRRGSGDG
jgi:transcriptional regulator with XRE-family HTH domain